VEGDGVEFIVGWWTIQKISQKVGENLDEF
jgi:hypothetical protein